MSEESNFVLSSGTRDQIRRGVLSLVDDLSLASDLDSHHFDGTPTRVVKAYEELFSGLGKDPTSVLTIDFPDGN